MWLSVVKAFFGLKLERYGEEWNQPLSQNHRQTENEACNKIIITGTLKELENLRNAFMHYCALYTWKQDSDLSQWMAGVDCPWRTQWRPVKVSFSLRWLIPMYGIRSWHDRVIQLNIMHQLVKTCVKNSSVHVHVYTWEVVKESGGPKWCRLHTLQQRKQT